jgi:nucleoside-diphosphate-sugar epimerase
VLPAFLDAAERGEPLHVFGDGRQTRSFGYVSDTVAGVLAVLDRGDGDPVNVGQTGEISVLDFARLVLDLTGSRSSIVHEPALPDDPRRREPDLARLKALGWTPGVPLREGLEKTIAWLRSTRTAGAAR